MKICFFGTPGTPTLPLGKHNLIDPRLDQADRLVEAKKKTYTQIDLLDEAELSNCDSILVAADHRADVILRDLELVETRLGRRPPADEESALVKLRTALENEQFASTVTLSDAERAAIAVHAFLTAKPVTVAESAEFEAPERLLLRAYAEAGFISYLTVGGKENRAWSIRRGATAWEAAGVIHSDMQKGFIRAEVIGWNDFLQAGGETPAKRAGKLRLETKTYVMEDYDVVNFRFNK